MYCVSNGACNIDARMISQWPLHFSALQHSPFVFERCARELPYGLPRNPREKRSCAFNACHASASPLYVWRARPGKIKRYPSCHQDLSLCFLLWIFANHFLNLLFQFHSTILSTRFTKMQPHKSVLCHHGKSTDSLLFIPPTAKPITHPRALLHRPPSATPWHIASRTFDYLLYPPRNAKAARKPCTANWPGRIIERAAVAHTEPDSRRGYPFRGENFTGA